MKPSLIFILPKGMLASTYHIRDMKGTPVFECPLDSPDLKNPIEEDLNIKNRSYGRLSNNKKRFGILLRETNYETV